MNIDLTGTTTRQIQDALTQARHVMGGPAVGMVLTLIIVTDESAQYGLRLFQQLNLQLLIVTPLQKIHIIEPFVASVGFVHNEGGRESRLRCLSIEEYRAQRAGGTAEGMAEARADRLVEAGADRVAP